jgi:hypothetical protein
MRWCVGVELWKMRSLLPVTDVDSLLDYKSHFT